MSMFFVLDRGNTDSILPWTPK